MSKRFTDTEKWKKSFIRGLQGPYKLLWLYVLDDCDMAGVWQVDIEVAQIRIGEKIDTEKAIEIFGDRVQQFDNGKKWFLKDFVLFQYGELKDTNRMHLAVINILKKNNLKVHTDAPTEPLPRGQGQGQGIIQGQGNGKGQGGEDEFVDDGAPDDWRRWGEQIVDENDQYWEGMKGRKVTAQEMKAFISVATRNDWKMKTQQAFRTTLDGFSPKNGKQLDETKRVKLI